MKKKILLMVAIVAVLICVFAISASAAVTPNNDGEVYITSDNKTLALYDAEGKALAWFKDSSVEFGYVAYRVEIDFTCTLVSGGVEIHTNTPTLNDTDGKSDTVFPYSLNDLVLINGRDYASFKQISGSFKNLPLEAVYVNNQFKWINKNTFNADTNIRVFDIPENHSGKLHFGEMCFWGASNLQKIFIPSGTYLESNAQFQNTGITTVKFAPNCTFTTIKPYMFYGCTNLTGAVVIPESVTTIDEYAFAFSGVVTQNTNNLSVTLPSGLSTLAYRAFQNNNSLTAISFTGESLTSTGGAVFESCKRLQSVVLPEGLVTLGNCAFNECAGLVSVTFPTTLTTLSGNNHFRNNTSLTTVIGLENTGLTSISENMFRGNKRWTPSVIRVPNTVEIIKDFGFADVGMISIYLGSQVESLGKETFTGCSSLVSVYIPETLTSINDIAFNGKGKLFFVTSNGTAYLNTIKAKSGASEIITYAKYSENPNNYAKGKYVISDLDNCETFYGGHIEAVLNGKDATCTETGLTVGSYCSRCNKTLVAQETTPLIGHSYNLVVTKPTCTVDGFTTYTCASCNDTYKDNVITANGHDVVSATCENDGYCKNCDEYSEKASGHSWTVTGSSCENNCGATRGAYIGSVNYATFSDAFANANEGDVIVLVTNITENEIITIEKSVTIDGNGFTLTSTASRAINIDTTGTVVISNLTVKAGERAFNIINQASTVTLNNVNAAAKNNAVMLATSAAGAKLTVNDSTFVGLATVNVASANSVVVINNTVIKNVDATEKENYGAISIFRTATNSTVTVNGGEIIVGDDSLAVSIGIPSATATLNNVAGSNTTQNVVAYIGNAGFATIEEALKEAKAGNTIDLVDNVSANEIITIEKSVTIDGNGYTLTSSASRAINIDTTGTVVISNLTVIAGERAFNIINQAANVTLSSVNATAVNNAVMLATSAEGATLTVNDSNFTGLATVNVASANSVVVINNTVIKNVDATKSENYGAISIFRTATNSTVTVNGGEIIVGDDSLAVSIGIPSATATLNNVAGSNTTQNVVAYIGNAGFATIEEALKEAKAGNTITLVDDVVLTSLIKIEKAITLDLGTYTVSTNAKKAFELYADATIINGTIAGACRCIDTRKAVNLTLENVTLIADKYYSEYSNQQPLTIGGNEDGTVVTMNNVTINAGTQGYDIISFVETTFNATDCTFIGYIGLFVKAGSENSVFNFANCDFTVDISKNDVEGNATALITVEASSVAVNLDKESTVTLIGNHTYIAYVADIKTVVVTLPSAYASDVVKSEYAVIDNANGTITVACPHAEAVVVNYIYANGYEAKGICVSKCTACDVELTSEAPRLFTFLGYSVPVDGKGEIAIGFEINKEAIAAYESVTGYKISYGIFAALESIGTKDIFESGSGAITAAVTSTSNAFDFKITGIETAEYRALNMAMGAYVIAEKGAEKTVSYMQGGKPEAEAKYIFVSYDLIASNS